MIYMFLSLAQINRVQSHLMTLARKIGTGSGSPKLANLEEELRQSTSEKFADYEKLGAGSRSQGLLTLPVDVSVWLFACSAHSKTLLFLIRKHSCWLYHRVRIYNSDLYTSALTNGCRQSFHLLVVVNFASIVNVSISIVKYLCASSWSDLRLGFKFTVNGRNDAALRENGA